MQCHRKGKSHQKSPKEMGFDFIHFNTNYGLQLRGNFLFLTPVLAFPFSDG
jgi:hypothetical protein